MNFLVDEAAERISYAYTPIYTILFPIYIVLILCLLKLRTLQVTVLQYSCHLPYLSERAFLLYFPD